MARYMLPTRAERFLNTLFERLFAEPSKKGGVTLGDLMPSDLRGQTLEEVLKEQPLGYGLLAGVFAPRGRGRLPDGFAVAKLLNSLFSKEGARRIYSAIISIQKRLEEKTGAVSFTLQTRTPLLINHTGPLGLPTFPLHPLWGIPVIPARLIKGTLRHYLISQNRTGEAEQLCGTTKQRGKAIIFDAYPASADQMRVGCEIFCAHNWLYHDGGPATDWHEPRVLLCGTIPPGVTFRFAVAGPDGIADTLKEALCEHGVGARRALGYGHFAKESGG